MKAFPALLGVGLLALILQGALARIITPPWCPDLALLVVIALGLRWPRFLSGVFLAMILGYAMDLVSGSLMGQHALLRLLTYLAAALAGRQLDLTGGLPVSILVFGTTFVYGIVIVSLLSFFVGSEGLSLTVLIDAFCHSIANVVAAGPMLSVVERVQARFSDDEAGRRPGFGVMMPRRGA